MNIPVTEIHDIFLTHEHTDHLLGMIWMIRVIGQAIQKGKYEGNCTIYCHDGLVNVLKTICELTLVKKITNLIGDRIILCPVRLRILHTLRKRSDNGFYPVIYV